MEKKLDPSHLDVVAFARDGESLEGQSPLSALPRLLDEQGQTIPAGRFLPWLERFGWMPRLDVLVLEKVLAHLRGHDQVLALNLSAATLAVRSATAFCLAAPAPG